MPKLRQQRRRAQQRVTFDIYAPRLSAAQTQMLFEMGTRLRTQRPRRWWVIGTPEPQPPTLRRALWLWTRVVGAFAILSTASVEAVVAVSVRGNLPYSLITPVYLALAAPIAAIAIINLAAHLHVPGRQMAG